MITTKQLPNISSLAHDYIYHYDKVAGFYNGDFRDIASYQHQADNVKTRHIERDKLTALLKEQNRQYGCSEETVGNINKLLHDQTGAVVTGQQVGLFSGPLYTIYKALTAVKLSEYLNQNCEACFIPIFWMASDDHDLAEINHINLFNKNNHIEQILYPSESAYNKTPVSDIYLTSEIENCIRQLSDLTHDSEFKQKILSFLTEAYRPGRSIVEAFAQWMTQLFKSYGLIFIDANHPDLKALGEKVFYKEIVERSPSTKQAIETSQKLVHADYHTQIKLHEDILNIFLVEEERRTILFKDNDFVIKDTRKIFKEDELLALLKNDPSLFSPNVMLRPIYQDTLLPTVAYIGGPSEIAYFAQMKGVYQSFGLPMPVIFPRKTGTLLEKKVKTVMDYYNLRIQDLWQTEDSIITEIVKKIIPDSIDMVLNTATTHLNQDFSSIKQEINAFDPSLKDTVDRTMRKILQQFQYLEKKTIQASKKRNQIVTEQLYKAKNNLFPNHPQQERIFNIVPYIIKYEYRLIDTLYQAFEINNHDHLIVKLTPD